MNNNSITKKTLIFKNCITKLFDSEINKFEKATVNKLNYFRNFNNIIAQNDDGLKTRSKS